MKNKTNQRKSERNETSQSSTAKPNLVDVMLKEFAKKVAKNWDNDELKKLSSNVSSENVTLIEDVPYIDDGGSNNQLDIYIPKTTKTAMPIIVDIHGGGFVSGSKKSDRYFCEKLAEQGCLVFSVDYTLAINGATVFDNVLEINQATSWIMSHAKEYGKTTGDVYLCGHSAGGMLATIEAILRQNSLLCQIYGINFSGFKYSGLILDCGFMRFYDRNLPYAMFRRVVFPSGYEKDRRYKNILFDKVPDIAFLPKTFLITNNKDELRNMTIYFYKLLLKNNVEAKLVKTKLGGHVGIIYSPNDYSDVFDEIKNFYNLNKKPT